jgi:Tol biopolymer transport system component
VANADGTNERPLVKTIPGFVDPKDDGWPRLVGWSPDEKWIAFSVFPAHGNADVRSYLYVVPSSGGILRRLAKEAYALDTPSWSRDSKSLYGVQGWSIEDRTHDLESPIVRVNVADGKLTALGAHGIWPQQSPNGKYLYYFTRPRPKLSRIRIDGGPEERLLDREDIFGFGYATGGQYVYLFQRPSRNGAGGNYRILRFDPESRQAIVLNEIPFQPRFANLSSDERFLYFGQQEEPKRRAVLVRGLF